MHYENETIEKVSDNEKIQKGLNPDIVEEANNEIVSEEVKAEETNNGYTIDNEYYPNDRNEDNVKQKKGIKGKIAICAGVTVLAVGTIVLCKSCARGEVENITKGETKTSTSSSITVEVTTTPVTTEIPFTTTNAATTSNSSSAETTLTEPNSNRENSVLEDAVPAVVYISAEDVVKLSRSYATYINKTATLSHKNYKFDEVKPEELYSVVYLANIDSVSASETQKLIEYGIISDNIETNVADSFNFYELYADDTINKIAEGKKNIIDLSLIITDKKGQDTAKIMNGIMTDSISATKEENTKNYIDTSMYYAEGVTLVDNSYDFSKSIYPTDRDELSVGADYTLSYAASCIDEIMKNKGVATKYYSDIMYNGRVDFSNVVQVFNGCKTQEIDLKSNKVLVK